MYLSVWLSFLLRGWTKTGEPPTSVRFS
jgi:hypothetical protein